MTEGKTPAGAVRKALFKGAVFVMALTGWSALAWGQIEVETAPPASPDPLTELSLEELMNVEVVTYSKTPERLFDTPAAIYVITQEDIRRSGVTTVPEALRMAPGVQVSRIDANKWAIGIRGFASRLSRSLLVMIDGRSVYSPLFAGVYWEVQDLLLEDIERIEVIRGPGGTVWGANAVNGVINIITKHTKETQGGLATFGAGTEERAFGGVRYGGAVNEHLHYRVYAKYFSRDAQFHPAGNDFDAWQMGQGGFRADLDLPNRNNVTLQGDYYQGGAGQRAAIDFYTPPFRQIVEKESDLSGGNLLFRWGRVVNERSDWAFKAYYDYTRRIDPTFQENRDTVDLDFQHRSRLALSQELTWGLEYRLTSGDTSAVPTIVFEPARRTDSLYSLYLQYKVALVEERLIVTVGSKFEHNNYSGYEVQPSGRILWKPSRNQAVWSGVTRAVRTPSRVEHDLSLTFLTSPDGPAFGRIIGEDNRFHSEKVTSYEVGYRIQPASRMFLAATAFYNRYTDLLSIDAGAPFTESGAPNPDRTIIPFFIENRMDGTTHGAEMISEWQALDRWRLNLIYSLLRVNLTPTAGSLDPFNTEESTEGSAPRHQVGLRSMVDLPGRVEFDWFLRYVDRLPAQAIRRYYNLDVRLGWRPTKAVELSLAGQNLLDSRHPEFGGGSAGLTEIERAVYGKVTVRWQ